MKEFYLFFLVLLASMIVKSQPAVRFDSSAVQVRSFNPVSIEKLKQDKDFQYSRYKEPVKSIWERFWDWVWYKITQIMSTRSGRYTVYTFLIILAVAVLTFFIFKMVGMDGGKLFGRKGEATLDYNVTSDNIHEISFDNAIENAIASGNFRLAVRLLYLQSLKRLSDKGLIEWKIDKTNSDYIHEVVNTSLHSLFRQLTNVFEYIWYGEMNITKEDFERLQVQFQQFNNQL